ncbi:MAG: NUDIX domain-containing protein [Chloroflexi bacterium]|jgi:8-oxo-dGTP diphosphatase|nr:NUDIX domain-containing protein [Chloroflexota bacterium]
MAATISTGIKRPAVLCILRSDQAMLLIRRNKEPNLGKYVPVGGHIDPYESPRAAAIREVREETGLEIDDARFCGVLVETSPTVYNWISFVYSADVERLEPPACREGSLEWVEDAQLESLPTPETDGYIYRLVAEGRRFVLDAAFDADLNLLVLSDELTGEILHKRDG